MTTDVWTVKDVLKWSIEYLKKEGFTTARLDAELLLSASLEMDRVQLYIQHHKPLIAAERQKFREFLQRRAKGEPVAYILGEKGFYGHVFNVTPSVLIPRPETEMLVDLVVNESNKDAENFRVLDIGTGSGCVAISIKQELDCYCEGWDISSDALAVARTNSEKLEAIIAWRQVNVLDGDQWNGEEKFDVIVSNPPYIAENEKETMSKSVVDYEPERALFADENGLAFYKVIAERARSRIESQGHLFLEVGYKQSDAVCEIFQSNGWNGVKTYKDLSGHQRVVSCYN